MAAVQMNIRIDEKTKAGGDAVLARFSMTPSAFVRKAYEKLLEDESPAWLDSHAGAIPARNDQVVKSDDSWTCTEGLAKNLAIQAGIITSTDGIDDLEDDDLRADAYFERATDRGLL